MMEVCLDQLKNQPRILIRSTRLECVSLIHNISFHFNPSLTDGQTITLLCKFVHLNQDSREQLAPLQHSGNEAAVRLSLLRTMVD